MFTVAGAKAEKVLDVLQSDIQKHKKKLNKYQQLLNLFLRWKLITSVSDTFP